MSTVFHVDEPGFDDLGEIVDGSHGSFNTRADGKLVSKSIDYKFDEPYLLDELRLYIDKTYDEHYSTSKIQTTEFIIDQGYGAGFCAGNVLKYTNRYGKKEGFNRKDILKALHYALILLHVHDLEHAE
jgi:hypothetical protein